MKERLEEKKDAKKAYGKPELTRRGKLTDVGATASKCIVPVGN